MPIAAPGYLRDAFNGDFRTASPALRFNMFLALWHDDWKKVDREKVEVTKKAAALNDNDIAAMKAIAQRQQLLATSPAFSAHMLTLCATATAPFTTGLGNEHPLENGFAFLTPYGLPYLAGSGVKGVLRQAARELAEGQWGDTRGWSKEEKYPHPKDPENKNIQLSMLDVLFGYEAGGGETLHTSGVLDFWDVIPQIPGKELAVEVMTPHQGHYYQQKNDRRSGSSISPHDSGQPNPITFLTVPPGSAMNFYVRCDEARLATLAQELMEKTENGEPRWKTLLTAAFEHAFEWLGFGAKTAVGYGAMQTEEQRQRRINEEKQRQQQRKEQEKAEAARQAEANAENWEGALFKYNRKNGMFTAEKDGQKASALGEDGKKLHASLPPAMQQTLLRGQPARGTARIARQGKEIKLLGAST